MPFPPVEPPFPPGSGLSNSWQFTYWARASAKAKPPPPPSSVRRMACPSRPARTIRTSDRFKSSLPMTSEKRIIVQSYTIFGSPPKPGGNHSQSVRCSFCLPLRSGKSSARSWSSPPRDGSGAMCVHERCPTMAGCRWSSKKNPENLGWKCPQTRSVQEKPAKSWTERSFDAGHPRKRPVSLDKTDE